MYAEQGPMGDLGSQVNSVLSGAYGPRGPRYHSVAEHAAVGAAIGVGAAVAYQGMRNRKARVGQFTTPTFRATALWSFLIVLVLAAYAATDNLWVLFGTFVLSGVVSCTYARRANRKLRTP